MIVMAQMRRFELLIARGRIGLLSATVLKADALLCSPTKRRPLCHICSYFHHIYSYYYIMLAASMKNFSYACKTYGALQRVYLIHSRFAEECRSCKVKAYNKELNNATILLLYMKAMTSKMLDQHDSTETCPGYHMAQARQTQELAWCMRLYS